MCCSRNRREIGECCRDLGDDEVPATFESARCGKDVSAVTIRDTFDAVSAGVGYGNPNARLWLIDRAVVVSVPVEVTVDDDRQRAVSGLGVCRNRYCRHDHPSYESRQGGS